MQYSEPLGSPRVGLLTLSLRLPGCRSLKEKRSLIRRLMARMGEDNLSVGEVGAGDRTDAATLACAAVSSSWEGTEKRLSGARRIADRTFGVQMLEGRIERLL